MKPLVTAVVILSMVVLLLAGVALVKKSRKREWSTKYLWYTLAAIAIIAVVGTGVWWGLSNTHGTSGTWSQTLSAPSPSGVWEFAKNYWLWILILGGIIPLVCSFFLPKEKENVAKGLQWLAGLAIVLFFVVAPVGAWIDTQSTPGIGARSAISLTAPANGNSPHISAPDAGYAPSFTGYGFVSHCVYSDGTDREYPCVKGPIVYYYVRDTSGKTNTVTYEFVRPE